MRDDEQMAEDFGGQEVILVEDKDEKIEEEVDYTPNVTHVYLNQDYKKKGLASYHLVL